jgi:hypothetical protein
MLKDVLFFCVNEFYKRFNTWICFHIIIYALEKPLSRYLKTPALLVYGNPVKNVQCGNIKETLLLDFIFLSYQLPLAVLRIRIRTFLIGIRIMALINDHFSFPEEIWPKNYFGQDPDLEPDVFKSGIRIWSKIVQIRNTGSLGLWFTPKSTLRCAA